MLWSAPSQYGFLSILLPALLPIKSAWNAFYVFQAIALFGAAALFYRTLNRCLGMSSVLALVLVIASFFLADPALIGPSSFPSSSAMRFVWCYALLAIGAARFLGERPSMRSFVRRATLPWVLGVLWSAESALYVTATLFTPVAVHGLIVLMSGTNLKRVLSDTAALVLYPLVWLGAVLVVIALVYAIGLGHLPDISMYFQYAVAYAAGFGALPLVRDGPIWVFALILIAGVISLALGLKRTFTIEGPAGAAIVAMGCIWSVTSYYVGRAVPTNVIALLPVLCFALAIIVRSGVRMGAVSRLQTAVSIPFFGLVFASAFWQPDLPAVLARLRPYPQDQVAVLPQADAELEQLLSTAGVSPRSHVTYYGYAASMPTTGGARPESFERTWINGPPQLLEEPISAERRALVFGRFAERRHEGGYFVQKRGEAEDRVEDWLRLIETSYRVRATFSSDHYRVILFEPDAQRH